MKVNFLLGEVVENPITGTYKSKKNTIGRIIVQTFDEDKVQTLFCKPANPRQKEIPLVGEHVLIFQGTNEYSTSDITKRQWYYFPAYGIQSNINHNALPIVADQTSNTNNQSKKGKLGKTFKQKTVSHMQPYEGDTLIQGRFSNSIRLGSTVNISEEDEDDFTLAPTWSGNKNGDPILILTNGHNDRSLISKGKPIIESLHKRKGDESSVYLTSRQQIQDLKLFREPSKSKPIESYNKSQLIGDADRIILRAKKDVIILDSPRRITLGSKQIRIGKEDAGHPLVKGDVLKMILNDLVAVINAGVIGPAGIASSPIMQGKLIGLLSKIGKLNSRNHYFDK